MCVLRILVSKAVSRTAHKEKISDKILSTTAKDAELGTFRADLGDETFKVDIARAGHGKSHGYRAILGVRPGHRAYFVFFWPKNEFDNINDDYLAGLKALIQGVMDMDNETLQAALGADELREIVQAQTDASGQAEQDQHGGLRDED